MGASLWRLELTFPGWRPGRLEQLAFAGEGARWPVISRQGRLAFGRTPPFDTDIFRLELKGGRAAGNPRVKLISSTRVDETPAFSPDGKRIAFTSNRSGRYEIWLSDSDGSNALQWTSTGGTNIAPYTTMPRWSTDGRWIYFESDMAGHLGIYAISADGGRPRPASANEAHWTSTSRDGRWIYFDSTRSGESQIWKIPAAGGSAVQLTRHGGNRPLASPNGRDLYYLKADSIWRLQNGEERQVVDSIWGLDTCLNAAVGERGIYFNRDSQQTLQFLDFGTNKIEQIGNLGENPACGFSLSPDGRQLLYTLFMQTSGGSDLMLVDNFR